MCGARSWVLCAAFYYPALLLAMSCASAFPGLLNSAFSGEHIVLLRVTPLGLMVWSAPFESAAHPNAYHSLFASALSLWILIPLATAILAGLIHAGLIRRILSGLAITVMADVALVIPFARFGRPGQISTSIIFSSVFFFVLLCLGLYWSSAGWAGGCYWERLAGLCAAAVAPPLLLWLLFWLFQVPQFRNFLLMLAPPAVVAAMFTSLRSPRTSAANSKPVKARMIFSGFGATVLLAVGVTWGGPTIGHAFQQRQKRTNQAAVANLPPIAVNAPYPMVFFQKGVSFSAEFPAPYASAGARKMLRSLRTDGVNAVALIPYGGMRLGSPVVRGFGERSWESDEGLRELSRLAHALGMKVMLKPGIWIRGGHFGGDIQFSAQANRNKWFREYGSFIERYARLATEIHADLFCVGGEFVHMSTYSSEWRSIIAKVRRVYHGPLTYAANFGDEFQDLKFWNALDYIGLQEYYPLPGDFSTDPLVAKIEAVQKRFHKPVIFTEVGFPSAPGANRYPWEDGKPGSKADLQLQARCYRAIFRAFYRKPWFKGMYWWKVGTNGFGGPDDTSLTPWGKPAMEVVKKWYGSGGQRNANLSRPAMKENNATR